jgi:HlyD family secretion protein
VVLAALIVASGCSRADVPDAYGNVEATEVTVSAEVGGQLVTFGVEEGQQLAAGAVVGSIDAKPLQLQRDAADAQRAATASRVVEVARQVPVLEAQREGVTAQRDAAVAQQAALQAQLDQATRNLERLMRLAASEAATAQQVEQANRDVRVLEEQVKAQEQQVRAATRQAAALTGQIAAIQAQRQTAAHQAESAAAQVAQIDDRIARAQVTNPSAGTVLVRYVRAGETVQPGQPLYKVADLSAVDVRAYVGETQLSSVKPGQQVQVTFDTSSDARKTATGTVSWISSRAEFTPTPIQTRDERADLVYAIKVRVANADGVLKIGMPVDVDFGSGR